MDFRQLRYALSVSKERSFTKAAKRLNISQSAVSEQVKLLEVFVAVKLLIICVGDCIELGFFLRGQEFWEVGRRIGVDLDLS